MPDTPSGYTLPPNSTAINGTTILAETHNIPVEDMAQALNNRMRRDGIASPMLAHMDMGGFRVRNVQNATLDGDVVTLGQLNALLANISSVPVGSLHVTTGTVLPTGYIWANGGSYSRSTYSVLWSWVQSSGNLAASQNDKTAGQYGPGNGTTTFTVPDLREYFVRSTSSGRNPGTVQADELKQHQHTGTTSSDTHSHNFPVRDTGDAGTRNQVRFATTNDRTQGTHTTSSDTHNHSFTTNNTGGSETRPKNIAYNYMIKV